MSGSPAVWKKKNTASFFLFNAVCQPAASRGRGRELVLIECSLRACAKHVVKAVFTDPPNSMVGGVLPLVYSWGAKAQQGHPAENPQVINEVLIPVSARPPHSLISYQEIITFDIQTLKTVLSTTLGYKWSLAVHHQ